VTPRGVRGLIGVSGGRGDTPPRTLYPEDRMSMGGSSRTRRVAGAGMVLFALAALAACDMRLASGPASLEPPQRLGVHGGSPGDTASAPPDSVPGDTTTVSNDTLPVDTSVTPLDTLRNPPPAPGALLQVAVGSPGDSVVVAGAFAEVTVTRGESNQVVASQVVLVGGVASFALLPGSYTVRLSSLPPPFTLAAGETAEHRVTLQRGDQVRTTFRLQRV
jgi:hypothetical protein